MERKLILGIVMVFVLSGIALAAPYGQGGSCCGGGYGPEAVTPAPGMPMMRGNFIAVAGPDAREKMDEIRKLNDEIRTELCKNTPDKSKARKLHDRLQDITQEIETMRFNERLSNPKPQKRFDGERKGISPQQNETMARIRDLHDAIRTELRKENPDKAKAQALHIQMQKLDRELESARFEEILKNPSNFCKGPGNRIKVPAAIRVKMEESRKLKFEISEELQKDIPNKAKIRDLNKTFQKIRNDIDDAMLEEMLKSPDKFRECQPGFGRFGICRPGSHHNEW